VVTGGKGQPLLLVHGWPQTWYAWRLVMPALAIGGAHSLGEQVAATMKLAADDVQTLVIPRLRPLGRRGNSRGNARRADRVPGPYRDGPGSY
jgi:pimeloyl-ACP methyl ester carboxylesterase